jgi:hypothetical protein
VTLHTARRQLKSIMQKTGVCRQSERAARLWRCDARHRSMLIGME